uniref:Uncharacterized protein n=1 Tax=Picea sitchensis TaxID=3332 RepID=A9NKQ1_PICSI|nr:unknown [Picea sitchensis]
MARLEKLAKVPIHIKTHYFVILTLKLNPDTFLLFAGKTFKQPSKKSKSDEMNSEITKFINQANEIKATTVACKEGAQFLIVKPPAEVVRTSNKK